MRDDEIDKYANVFEEFVDPRRKMVRRAELQR